MMPGEGLRRPPTTGRSGLRTPRARSTSRGEPASVYLRAIFAKDRPSYRHGSPLAGGSVHIRANSLEDPWLFGSPLAGTAAKPQQRALQCPSFAAADAPRVAGACLHQEEAQPVHLVYQRVHCASVLHTRCPVFQGSEKAPWQPETPTRVRRYPRHRVWLGAIVVLVLAAIGAVVSLRPAGESEDSLFRLPASGTTPLAVVMPDVVAVPVSLEPIPTPPPLDVRAAPPIPAAPPTPAAAPAAPATDVQWQQTVEAALQPLVALQIEPAPLSPPRRSSAARRSRLGRRSC